MATLVAKVCVLHTNRDAFDYYFEGPPPLKGARVWVPFRNQKRLGIVIDFLEIKKSPHTLKSIENVIDVNGLLPAELINLSLWISQYYQTPLSEVLPLVLPKKYRLGEAAALPTALYYDLTVPVNEAHQLVVARAKRQHELIDFCNENPSVSKKSLLQQGFTDIQLGALLHLNILRPHEKVVIPERYQGQPSYPLQLNPEQHIATQTICSHLENYRCFLLQGVTGSGKTEVYLQVIEKILNANKQVLILVPEIGLTPQLLARFRARFCDESIVVLHSNLNDRERQVAWQLAYENQVKLVVGTRSAVFTPLPHLGLIIIDEEHDASLKQMEGVRYSARDTALMRAYLANIPIILGSATPSLESFANAQTNKYHLLSLNQKALTSAPLHYQIVDLRNQIMQDGLAPKTLTIIENHLQQQNQVLVFINRRGFAPVLLCHQCGWMADCRACDSHLTLHRVNNRLICHHCGLSQQIVEQCAICQSKELISVGTGTQRVFEYLTKQYPDTSIIRIDRDEVRKKNALHDSLERINSGEAQLIVGTQMLAKGHHFPRLTLVVVLDADSGFYNQDFRALERLGQLLLQVAGRAGRAERPGQVVIQTHIPQHPLLNILIKEGYSPFAQALLTLRQEAAWPPYHFLAVIRAQGKHLPTVLDFLHTVKVFLQEFSCTLLGPAPAPLARKSNYYRMQLLIKSSSRKQLQSHLSELRFWLEKKNIRGVRWNIDVDPIDLS